MTPQTLENDLEKGVIDVRNIVLIVYGTLVTYARRSTSCLWRVHLLPNQQTPRKTKFWIPSSRINSHTRQQHRGCLEGDQQSVYCKDSGLI